MMQTLGLVGFHSWLFKWSVKLGLLILCLVSSLKFFLGEIMVFRVRIPSTASYSFVGFKLSFYVPIFLLVICKMKDKEPIFLPLFSFFLSNWRNERQRTNLFMLISSPFHLIVFTKQLSVTLLSKQEKMNCCLEVYNMMSYGGMQSINGKHVSS